MIEQLSKMFLDTYDRNARLAPALLAIVPVPILVICLAEPARKLGPLLVSILLYCGAGFLLARASRNAGKSIQNALYAEWGGAPTTQVLRHRSSHFNAHIKARMHAVLSRGLARPFPNADEEAADLKAADAVYEAGTAWMIGQTRDQKRFPLVLKENIAYGFHRNAFAIRTFGIACSILCFVVALFAIVDVSVSPFKLSAGSSWGAMGFLSAGSSLLLLASWLFVLNKEAVRMAGFSYAERLFESCENLAQPQELSSKKTAAGASTRKSKAKANSQRS